jgi:hypothetical protein
LTSFQQGPQLLALGLLAGRFPVRSTRQANAIMTAVDQAGNKIARYQVIGMIRGTSTPQFAGLWKAIEITVHPGRR